MFNKIPIDKQFHFWNAFILALVAWQFSGPAIPDWPSIILIHLFGSALGSAVEIVPILIS